MYIIYVFIAAAAVAGILWLMFSKKRDSEKAVSYECPHCGELHCDCYQKSEAGGSDSD